MKKNENFIGRTVLITILDIKDVPAKVDTGAESSSVWASDIRVKDGVLSFKLFDEGSPYYTGKRITKPADEYSTVTVTSSTGHRQLRYVVTLPAIVKGKHYDVRFTLANRMPMIYSVLLGRFFLDNTFVVDTSLDLPVTIQEQLRREMNSRVQALRTKQRKGKTI